MPLIPPNDPLPASYAQDKDALWRDIRALWERVGRSKTIGGVGLVIVQPDEPEDVEIGTLWFDTDESTSG